MDNITKSVLEHSRPTLRSLRGTGIYLPRHDPTAALVFKLVVVGLLFSLLMGFI